MNHHSRYVRETYVSTATNLIDNRAGEETGDASGAGEEGGEEGSADQSEGIHERLGQ